MRYFLLYLMIFVSAFDVIGFVSSSIISDNLFETILWLGSSINALVAVFLSEQICSAPRPPPLA